MSLLQLLHEIYTPFSRRNYEFRELDSYPASVMQVYRVVLKILVRIREWLAKMLGWAAEQSEADSCSLAGMFLHNSVKYLPFSIARITGGYREPGNDRHGVGVYRRGVRMLPRHLRVRKIRKYAS